MHDVRDPDATIDHVRTIIGGHADTTIDPSLDDPGFEQRRVEAITRVGEVGLRGGSPEPGVDADEQQPEAGAHEVRHRCVDERFEFSSGKPHVSDGRRLRHCRMANDHWPLFDLEVRTPRLTLRYLDDALASELIGVAQRGVHDRATMPFMVPWTDLPSPQMEQEALRFFWRTRAAVRPDNWNLQFAVIVGGAAIGLCDVGADHFAKLRQVTTGSWLGREFHGHGLGKEFRLAALTLAFDGLGADFALSSAWHDNAASLGVTRSLGYQEEGRRRALRRDEPDELIDYRMDREHWTTIRRDDVTLAGLASARSFLEL